MHEPPNIPHHGRPGTGLVLKPGMTFTIEPMLNLGGPEIRLMHDGWTVVTADGSLSAQFEHTVHVTREGAEILTDLRSFALDSSGGSSTNRVQRRHDPPTSLARQPRHRWTLDGADNPHGMSGLQILPADLARLGQLLLEDGKAGDEQLISRDGSSSPSRQARCTPGAGCCGG